MMFAALTLRLNARLIIRQIIRHPREIRFRVANRPNVKRLKLDPEILQQIFSQGRISGARHKQAQEPWPDIVINSD